MTIVVGYDGSADTLAALQWAAGLSRALGARLHIVHAVGILEGAGLAHVGQAHKEAARQAAVDAGADATTVEWSSVDGDPCTALLRAAGADGSALVVVGTRGTGAHQGSVIGSTSLELAEHARVPVVIVPNPVERDGQGQNS